MKEKWLNKKQGLENLQTENRFKTGFAKTLSLKTNLYF